MTDDELTAAEEALLAEFAELLADPSTWVEPDEELEHVVVAAIVAEAAGESTSRYRVYAQPSRVRRWLATAGAVVAGAAAAVAITFIVTRDAQDHPDASVAMAGTELAPGLSGSAVITTESSGVRIEMKVPGLPRREGGEFYQVWLKNCAGSQLIPAGSFHQLDYIVAWAGVSPVEFPIISVTREVAAGPTDEAQGSSGEVVVKGAIDACPT